MPEPEDPDAMIPLVDVTQEQATIWAKAERGAEQIAKDRKLIDKELRELMDPAVIIDFEEAPAPATDEEESV